LRIDGIQGLRGIAVLFVVLGHVGLAFPNGFIGVDAFFVVSGFVITKSIMRRVKDGSFSLKNFYGLRFKRLFLPMAATVTASVLASLFFLSAAAFYTSLKTGTTALLGVSNGYIHVQTGDYFGSSVFANALTHTWSLAVEEQFYLLFPLLFTAFATLRSARVSRTGLGFLAVGTLTSFFAFLAHPLFIGVSGWGAVFSYYSPVIRAWEFGVGALLFFFPWRKWGNKSAWAIEIGALGLLIALANIEGLGEASQGVMVTLAAVIATLLMISLSTNGRPRIITAPSLMWIGNRSYSIYLVHWPVAVFLITYRVEGLLLGLIATALSLLIGNLWFDSFEKGPLAKLIARQPFRTGSIAAVVLVVTLVASVSLFPVIRPEAALAEEKRNMQASLMTCDGAKTWCFNGAESDSEIESAEEPIYLIGDSNASMLYWGLRDAADAIGRPLFAWTNGACSPSEVLPNTGKNCREYREKVLDSLGNAAIGTVVLGYSDGYVNPGRDFDAQAIETLLASIDGLEDMLTGFGHEVIVVQPIPNLTWDRDMADIDTLIIDRMSASIYLKRPFQDRFRSVFSGRANGFEKILRTEDIFCPDDKCLVVNEGDFIWRDDSHLTRVGSLMLSPSWIDSLG